MAFLQHLAGGWINTEHVRAVDFSADFETYHAWIGDSFYEIEAKTWIDFLRHSQPGIRVDGLRQAQEKLCKWKKPA